MNYSLCAINTNQYDAHARQMLSFHRAFARIHGLKSGSAEGLIASKQASKQVSCQFLHSDVVLSTFFSFSYLNHDAALPRQNSGKQVKVSLFSADTGKATPMPAISILKIRQPRTLA